MTRKTLVALGTFGVLLLLVLVVRLMPEKVEEIAWSIPKLADTMDRVEVVRQGNTVVLEKKGEDWVITQPKVYEASETALKGLVELFDKPIGMDLKVPIKKEELARFEVDDEKGITVKVGVNGKEAASFVVGKTQGSRTFVKPLDQDVAYRAKASLRWKLDKGLEEWREKKVIGVDQKAVTKLEITQQDGTKAELVKEGDVWKITQPAEAAADGSTVSSLVSALGSLTAAAFADDVAPEQAGFGPADRPYTVVVTTSADGDKGPRGIEIGKVVGKEQLEGKYTEDFFARRKGESQLYVVRSYSVNNLRKKLSELKDRTVFKLPQDQVTGLTLKTPGQEIVFAKEGDAWKATKPAELVGKLDESQVRSLVSTLSMLRANELAEDGTSLEAAGLAGEPASGKVEVQLQDGGSKVLLLGKKLEGDTPMIYAKLADKETIFKLNEYSSRRFLTGPSSFRKVDGNAPSPDISGSLPPGMPHGMPE